MGTALDEVRDTVLEAARDTVPDEVENAAAGDTLRDRLLSPPDSRPKEDEDPLQTAEGGEDPLHTADGDAEGGEDPLQTAGGGEDPHAEAAEQGKPNHHPDEGGRSRGTEAARKDGRGGRPPQAAARKSLEVPASAQTAAAAASNEAAQAWQQR